MAEEKKETTKKTPKTEAVEEVKVEKRFCTNCGRELKEGEVCNCTANTGANNASSINGDAIVNTCKDIWHTIINVFKKPATTVSEEANSSKSNKSIILIIVLAISYALYLMAMFANMAKSVESAANSIWSGASASVDVPYFQIFIYGIIIYAILAILPVVAALVVAKIAKNRDFTFKKSFNLYITSNAPMVFCYLGMAIILLLNVSLLTVLGTIATLIISLFCFFNFILGFNAETRMKEDRRSYAITGLIAFWIVMVIVAFLIVGATIFGSIVSDVQSTTNDINDIFNW